MSHIRLFESMCLLAPSDIQFIQKYLLFTKIIIIIIPQFVRRRVNLDMKQIIFTRFRCQHTFFIGWQLGLGQTFITVVFLNIWWIVTKIFWNNSKMSPLPGLIEVLSFLSDKYPAWQSVAYRQRWLKQTSHQNAETKKYQLYTFVTTNATVAQYSRKLLGNFFETTCRIPYFYDTFMMCHVLLVVILHSFKNLIYG